MAETLAVKLARVQAAIAAIEDGPQSYSIANHTYTKASLKILHDREQKLLNIIATEGTAGRTIAEF